MIDWKDVNKELPKEMMTKILIHISHEFFNSVELGFFNIFKGEKYITIKKNHEIFFYKNKNFECDNFELTHWAYINEPKI